MGRSDLNRTPHPDPEQRGRADESCVIEITNGGVVNHRHKPFAIPTVFMSAKSGAVYVISAKSNSMMSPLVLAAATALLLFVVGPQLGSFDADGDGIPEIPVVLAGTNGATGATASTGKVASQRVTRDLLTRVVIPTRANAVEIHEFEFSSHVSLAALHSMCPLRC
jgi:hypothetical protein